MMNVLSGLNLQRIAGADAAAGTSDPPPSARTSNHVPTIPGSTQSGAAVGLSHARAGRQDERMRMDAMCFMAQTGESLRF
jgi:hypothetical protein